MIMTVSRKNAGLFGLTATRADIFSEMIIAKLYEEEAVIVF